MTSTDSNTTQRTLTGLLWMSSGAGMRAVLHLLVMLVLARLLAPYDFGVVGAAIVIVQLSEILANLGVGAALVQRPDVRAVHIGTGLTMSVGLGALLAACVWFAAPAFGAFFRMSELSTVLRVLSATFLIESLNVVPYSILTRELRFRRLAIVELLAVIIGYGATGILLAMQGFGVWALVGAHLAKSCLKTLLLCLSQPSCLIPRFDRHVAADLAYFGGGVTMGQLGSYFATQADRLIVGRYLGPVALGVYGRAFQLTHGSAYLIGTPIEAVMFPVLAKIQDNPTQLASAYRRGLSLLSVFILPLTTVGMLLAPEIVTIMLGGGWEAATVPFQILLLGIYFRLNDRFNEALLRASGAVYRMAWRRVVFGCLVVAGAGIGQRYGLPGVAVAVLAALLVQFLLMTQLSLYVIKLSWGDFLRTQARGVAGAAALCAITWLVAENMREWGFAALTLVACTVGILGILTVALHQELLGPDAQWILQHLRRLTKPRQARGFSET